MINDINLSTSSSSSYQSGSSSDDDQGEIYIPCFLRTTIEETPKPKTPSPPLKERIKKESTDTDPDSKYKTEMCRTVTRNKTCTYAQKCRFAHTEDELRPVERPKYYKTKRCKNFDQGYCPYGSRCKFDHIDDLLKSNFE
jgi:hypothetical protein